LVIIEFHVRGVMTPTGWEEGPSGSGP
jgi:hypothetical protein